MNEEHMREELLRLYQRNRYLAHKELFAHRHKDETPEFHKEICELLYSPSPLVAMQAFRGAAKSTWLEEYILLSALFRDFVFPLIVGSNWTSACDRLAPIKQELETNDMLIELFGDQKAAPWTQDEICLANGVKIRAVGAGQSMRGVKHNDERPDLAAIDDLEDEENIATEESRRKTERWLNGTLRPALHPRNGKVRFIGTPIHPKALIQKKCDDPEWASRKFPALYLDEQGQERSTWPARFSTEWLQKLRTEYLNNGQLTEFQQEYMCLAEDAAGKPFQAGMIKVAPVPQVYMPVEIVVDPARTVKTTSARTGYVAGSWFGNKLVVHEALGAFDRPDEIINRIFEWNKRFNPVHIGVESNSLEEFIMQPLRATALRLGISLPIVDLRAPKNKEDFIKGLQPLYISGNVIHAKHLPDLESELLQFPTGRMDVPNALAYFLRMRAGRPVYEDFAGEHITSILEVHPSMPRWLVMSSRPAITGAVLLQYAQGAIRIYRDWVLDRPPVEAFPVILREAIMVGEGPIKLAAPLEQFDTYMNNGLPAAAARDNITVTRTALAAKSEGKLKSWLTKREHGEVAFLVAQDARWTINALARGYARKLEKHGALADFPADNQYRVIAEAIESFVGWFDASTSNIADKLPEARYATARDGRKYITLMPDKRI